MIKHIRSRAPLRIGFAGGGTDVSPFCDKYGGIILNGTITMYAYATIVPQSDNEIKIQSQDRLVYKCYRSEEYISPDGSNDLVLGVYNRVIKDFVNHPLSFEITTWVDAPPGSGLGSSSTLVVAILGAFVEWLKLPLGEYDIAHLAFDIERNDLRLRGGKQDQFAATFGGINFMEFYDNDKVIVNPLRIPSANLNELSLSLLLYYTGTSRDSSKIIESQIESAHIQKGKSFDALMLIKKQAMEMKNALLRGELNSIGELLDWGWALKKQTSTKITNQKIDKAYRIAKKAGATGGKISGAGGGGFMIFYCPGNTRYEVIKKLSEIGGEFRRFQFEKKGVSTWTI